MCEHDFSNRNIMFTIGISPVTNGRSARRGESNAEREHPPFLAISSAGSAGTHPAAKLAQSEDERPEVNGLPVSQAVEKLFERYKAE